MEAPANPVTERPRISALEWALVCVLFLFAFLPTLLTANHYGMTYDEPHYASAGAEYAEWWSHFFRGDRTARQAATIERVWNLNHEHPPLQKSASGFAQRWFGGTLPGLGAMRLPSALWFALTVCALYLFTRNIWGRRGALFGALAFATMPRVVAHAHLVALDMPITAWFFITVALTSRALSRNSWRWTVLAGIAFGLALMSKMNAFFLPLLLLPWGLVYYRSRWPKLLALLLLIGPAVFWMGWPWLWIDSLPHLRDYLDFHFRHAAYNIWYLGELYQYAPWHYPFVLTAVATPTLLVLLSLIGVPRAWPRRGLHPDRALLLFGLAICLLPSALPMSPKYIGVRLFLPAFPFLAALAGGGFAWLQARAIQLLRMDSPGRTRLSPMVAALLGMLLLYPGVKAVVDTHPYPLAFYNALVGGTAGATNRGFETIYWGQVYQQAPAFLNEVDEAGARVLLIPRGVIYLLEFQQRSGNLRLDVEFTGDQAEAKSVDYVMFQCMQSDYTDLCWALTRSAEPAWALKLGQTPLLVAYGRTAVAEALDRPSR